jgi:hypothetical protein
VKPNPLQIDRINAVNWRLCNDKGVRRLFVDRKCKHTIKDMREVKYIEGRKEIDKSDEKKGLVHITDALGYYINYEYSLKGKPEIHLIRR